MYLVTCPEFLDGYEVHSPEADCYLFSMSRGRRKRGWQVVWKGKGMAIFFKRQWAREHLHLLKIQEIHES